MKTKPATKSAFQARFHYETIFGESTYPHVYFGHVNCRFKWV